METIIKIIAKRSYNVKRNTTDHYTQGGEVLKSLCVVKSNSDKNNPPDFVPSEESGLYYHNPLKIILYSDMTGTFTSLKR